MDKTKHIEEQHSAKMPDGTLFKHGKKWYAFWGNKCPVCHVEAEVEE